MLMAPCIFELALAALSPADGKNIYATRHWKKTIADRMPVTFSFLNKPPFPVDAVSSAGGGVSASDMVMFLTQQ